MSDTVEERVNRVLRRLLLLRKFIRMKSLVDETADHTDIEGEDDAIADAIHELLCEMISDLEPVTHAPGEVANWTPPKKNGAAA